MLLWLQRRRKAFSQKFLNLLIILIVLFNLFVQMPQVSAAPYSPPPTNPTAATNNDLQAPTSQPITVSPEADPHLPSLSIHATITPNQPTVGDTVTVTYQVMNSAPDPASNLVFTLPVPDGATPQAGDGLVSATQGWQWNLAQLAGNSATVTFTATLTISSMPTGEALLLHSQVTATGLVIPIQDVSGVLVNPVTTPTNIAPSPNTFQGSRNLTEEIILLQNSGKSRFNPGQDTELRSPDGRVKVLIPGKASKTALDLKYKSHKEKLPELVATGAKIPPDKAGNGKGFGTFHLEAADDKGKEVHKFEAPLTISQTFTSQQLQALRLDLSAVTLFWFDETKKVTLPNGSSFVGDWVALPTQIDDKTLTATAQVDHFSAYQFSDGTSASTAFLPTLQNWQENLFTGGLSYNYPIDVPAGPGGVKPSVALSYNSTSNDGITGQSPTGQAGWIGRGWSLDTGSVSLNKAASGNYYSLSFNGVSTDLFDAGSGNFNMTNGAFIRAQKIGFDTSWKVWASDGTLYEFTDQGRWGWNLCTEQNSIYHEVYKWNLTKITDTHGNTITYTYTHDQRANTTNCNGYILSGNLDWDIYPSTISWGANANVSGSADRYKVQFVVSARPYDAGWENASNQMSSSPHQTVQLDSIQVFSNSSSPFNSGSWQKVRQYNLCYANENRLGSGCQVDYSTTTSVFSDNSIGTSNGWVANTAYPRLTLMSIQKIANDGTTALPATTFSYGLTRGTDTFPIGGWNRIITMNNNQGGQVNFNFEVVGRWLVDHGVNCCSFKNNHRLLSKTITSGTSGQAWYTTGTWSYSYTNPAANGFGTILYSNEQNNNQVYPNSAALYYNKYLDTNTDQSSVLMHKAYTEFRGHNKTTVTAPDGTVSEHYFYQGDVGCVPAISGTNIPNDSCFQQLRDREFLKGKEYKTIVKTSATASPALQYLAITNHTFATTFYDYGGNPLSGDWRAWTYETQTEQKNYEGSGTDEVNSQHTTKTTKYYYEPAYQDGGSQYGNLTRSEVYDSQGSRVSETRIRFATKVDSTNYIVNRSYQVSTFDGLSGSSQNRLTMAWSFYDGNLVLGTLGTAGDVTRSRTIISSGPIPVSLTGLVGTDATFGYDTWGNKTTSTTYLTTGTSDYNSTTGLWSHTFPSNTGSRTSTVTYDSLFHSFSTQVQSPTVGSVTLTEQASYDYRMGTLSTITDVNNNTSSATYDGFGRMLTMLKPGDTSTYPALTATYYDTEIPYRYIYRVNEGDTVNNYTRPITLFYDGQGRVIQNKSRSVRGGDVGAQQIVSDTRYDNMGRVLKTSQARYIGYAQNDPNFLVYAPADTDTNMRWTVNSYDPLGRVYDTTAPDNTKTSHRYAIGAETNGVVTLRSNVIDANRHRSQTRTDSLGRTLYVAEITGNCDNTGNSYLAGFGCGGSYTTPWSYYATTSYSYNALSQLTQVTDNVGNNTTISYDSLGRKTSMSDPDMGSWSYGYDVNSNLITQTDAKSQTITNSYDALNRLKTKTYPGTGNVAYFNYDESSATNGKGQRTSISNTVSSSQVASTNWSYDNRGRVITTTYVVNGLSGTRTFNYTYDSADRLLTTKYPSLTDPSNVNAADREIITNSFNAAWRPLSICSNQYSGICYASGATYNALSQPTQVTLGNSLQQNWAYTSPLSRLNTLKVGTSGNTGSLFNRSYTYDNVGNIGTIADAVIGQTNTYGYDDLNRLTSASAGTPSGAMSSTFPITSNIDSFNRANGAPGIVWVGDTTSTFSISSNQLAVSNASVSSLYWKDAFGADQEAFATLSTIQASSGYISLGLKAQDTSQCNNLQVRYLPSSSKVQVYACSSGTATQQGSDIAVTFAAGDKFGARAKSNGTVEVYKNSTLVGSVTVAGSWPYLALGGKIGLGASNASGSVFDDFGGGTIPTPPPASSETYGYDTIGNLTTKAGVNYSYPTSGQARPHTPNSVAGVNRTYDLNGNLTGGDNRTYSWNYDNKPSSVTGIDLVQEQYGYDGDTNRVYRTRNGITTFYLGQWEETSTGVKKQYYSFGGSSVAVREYNGVSSSLTYLHSDHLGSVSLATTSGGNIASQQYFDPWGKVKSGGIGQTTLNYTGQRLDGTGLLYYNARYYDPALGKFLTPDNVSDGVNRYAYVHNNPIVGTDPTGHYSRRAPVEEYDEPMSDVAAQVAVAATIAVSNTEQAQADAHAPIPTGNPKPDKPLPSLSDPGEADKEQRDQDKLNSPCVPGETTILGNFKDTKLFVDNPQPGKDALFLERYTWDKNQQWLDRSLRCGNDYALASDPVRMENGANIPIANCKKVELEVN